MRHRRAGKRLLAAGLVFVLLVTGSLVAGVPRVVVASPIVADVSPYVNVTATSFMFSPNLIEQVPTNVTVHIVLLDGDAGGTAHTFTIWKYEGHQIPSASSDVLPYVYGHGANEGNLVNVNVSGAGAYAYGNLTVTSPGWYEFLCTEAGHFSSGMLGYIAFGENLPANLSVVSPDVGAGAAVFIIVGTIVTLTVIAIVLGFVVGRRRGSQFEMPPERLGYPEPARPAQSPPLSPTPPHS